MALPYPGHHLSVLLLDWDPFLPPWCSVEGWLSILAAGFFRSGLPHPVSVSESPIRHLSGACVLQLFAPWRPYRAACFRGTCGRLHILAWEPCLISPPWGALCLEAPGKKDHPVFVRGQRYLSSFWSPWLPMGPGPPGAIPLPEVNQHRVRGALSGIFLWHLWRHCPVTIVSIFTEVPAL